MATESSREERPSLTGSGASPRSSGRRRPERPAVKSPVAPPVIVKRPPPMSVRLSQLLWALSLITGVALLVYYFIVREDLLPLIVEAARTVDDGRAEATYTAVGDTVYWSFFAFFVLLLLVQVTLLVSFTNRRSGARWWQMGTVLAQVVLYAVGYELLAHGEHGVVLRQMATGQVGLALLALLLGAFPGAIAWTARKYDVRDGAAGSISAEY